LYLRPEPHQHRLVAAKTRTGDRPEMLEQGSQRRADIAGRQLRLPQAQTHVR
jgi:hypothetical protein